MFNQFRKFQATFQEDMTDECFDFMRIAFDDYLVNAWDGRYLPEARRSICPSLGKEYVSETTAGRQLGCSSVRIRRLVKLGKLTAIEHKAYNTNYLLVRRTSIDDYRRQFESSLSTKKVRALLGLSQFELIGLIKAKVLLPRCGPGGRPGD